MPVGPVGSVAGPVAVPVAEALIVGRTGMIPPSTHCNSKGHGVLVASLFPFFFSGVCGVGVLTIIHNELNWLAAGGHVIRPAEGSVDLTRGDLAETGDSPEEGDVVPVQHAVDDREGLGDSPVANAELDVRDARVDRDHEAADAQRAVLEGEEGGVGARRRVHRPGGIA